MELTPESLRRRILERGLPEAAATIATQGGSAVHPALEFTAESISLTSDGPSISVIRHSGRTDLVPLWTSSATVTVFSAADGSFLEWSAEDDEQPWQSWPDFASAVRHLLTDLYENMVSDEHRHEVAALLLPEDQIAAAMVPEER
ncbi:hypothetical protein [Nocardioides alcanivorans]|uniref:hypothetical protein n=1 Tax=Nocardioides alcanivorans TaxID=2897352 RepID=UPI001F170ADB|nr:hypothetical protein [Nocardioides alcanivorans]